jgi:hypothetical protein
MADCPYPVDSPEFNQYIQERLAKDHPGLVIAVGLSCVASAVFFLSVIVFAILSFVKDTPPYGMSIAALVLMGLVIVLLCFAGAPMGPASTPEIPPTSAPTTESSSIRDIYTVV